MTDITLDVLLEAVRQLANEARNRAECPCEIRSRHGHCEGCPWNELADLIDKLDALIAQRKGKE